MLKLFKKKEKTKPFVLRFEKTRNAAKIFNNCRIDQEETAIVLLKTAIEKDIAPEDQTPENLYKADIQKSILYEYFLSCKSMENELFENGEVYARKIA
jgi:hypothetical protein